MIRRASLAILLTAACISGRVGLLPTAAEPAEVPQAAPEAIMDRGPLHLHPSNPRYFADGNGRPVYLTGSHTWANVQDVRGYDWVTDLSEIGGFEAYLKWLQSYNHNFIRLWIPEHAWDAKDNATVSPLPWPRTGPGLALDGKPKFDLNQFDPAYFDRLRARAVAAGERGFYVSVMLFDSWSIEHRETWQGHAFNAANNVSGVDGEANNDGLGTETHTLKLPAVTRLQEAYARKVVDTLNDLDNVLYEISNESEYGADWHYHLLKILHDYEATKPQQHPVGMTGAGPRNSEMVKSDAEWISPDNSEKATYKTDPPANDTGKVSLLDTDHLGKVSPSWVWKSFTRGHNPILMDWMEKPSPWYSADDQETMRKAMGQTRALAQRLDLATMTPRPELASTRYCLADLGKEYVVYLPTGGRVTLDLGAATGAFGVEWIDPVTGTVSQAEDITGGTADALLTAPFAEGAVLHLWRKVRGR